MKLEDVTLVDFGCGRRKKDGHFGIDIASYSQVDKVMDLRFAKLPFNSEQLEGAYASHFMEHLTFEEAIFFMNEVFRVLKNGCTFEIIVPHAMSYAQYADLSHKSAWTEDTFGYFTQDNEYYYEWGYENPKTGERDVVINRWVVLRNDSTPPFKYSKEGWINVKLREINALMQKKG
jgi:hypothetical protein